MLVYQTRLIGLNVIVGRDGLGDRVHKFKWVNSIKLPLTDKQIEKIESNCKYFIVGSGLKQSLYKINVEPETLPPSNQGKYVSVADAVSGEF